MGGNLLDSVAYIQTQAAAIAGVRHAPASPTDALPVFPAVVTFPLRLDESIHHSYGHRQDTYTIETQIHVPRKDLARDMATLNPMWNKFLTKVWNQAGSSRNLEGACDAVRRVTGQLVVEGEWAGQETLYISFQTVVMVTSPDAT